MAMPWLLDAFRCLFRWPLRFTKSQRASRFSVPVAPCATPGQSSSGSSESAQSVSTTTARPSAPSKGPWQGSFSWRLVAAGEDPGQQLLQQRFPELLEVLFGDLAAENGADKVGNAVRHGRHVAETDENRRFSSGFRGRGPGWALPRRASGPSGWPPST